MINVQESLILQPQNTYILASVNINTKIYHYVMQIAFKTLILHIQSPENLTGIKSMIKTSIKISIIKIYGII